jgi:hypothetical protein
MLKEHMKAGIKAVLPNMSELKGHEVDLKHLKVVPKMGTVTMYLRPLGAVITQMLTDTSRVGPDSEHIDLAGALRDSLSGSNFVARLGKGIPEGRDQVTLNVFHDGALVDAMFSHSMTPITASIAQHSTTVAMSNCGSELLGYVLLRTSNWKVLCCCPLTVTPMHLSPPLPVSASVPTA